MEVVHWLAKEALGGRSMQIHSDDMIYTGDREEVGYQFGGDGTSVRLLLRLSRVDEVWHYSSNTLRGTSLARGDHDEHLQKTVVDLVASALDNEDILVPNRRFKADRDFAVAELLQFDLGWCGSEAFANGSCQERVGGTREDFDAPHDDDLEANAISFHTPVTTVFQWA